MNKFYFNENSPFSPGFYRYYDLITKTGNFSCSTNALESINRRLKTVSGSGHLTYSKSFRVIRDFKINYLLLHEDRVRNDNLNRKKKSTLSREAKLENILEDYSLLSFDEQIINFVSTAFKIGTMDKFISLSEQLLSTNILSTATTEEELDDTIFATFLHSDSDSESDSEF